MRTPSPTLALIIGAALAAGAATYQPGYRVIDGDTVDHAWWRWRIAGLDAPELHAPKCPAERAAAKRAARRLRALLAAGGVTIEPRGGRDKYRRRIARLRLADGRDVATVLIAEGLGHPYDGHGQRGGWCPGGS